MGTLSRDYRGNRKGLPLQMNGAYIRLVGNTHPMNFQGFQRSIFADASDGLCSRIAIPCGRLRQRNPNSPTHLLLSTVTGITRSGELLSRSRAIDITGLVLEGHRVWLGAIAERDSKILHSRRVEFPNGYAIQGAFTKCWPPLRSNEKAAASAQPLPDATTDGSRCANFDLYLSGGVG